MIDTSDKRRKQTGDKLRREVQVLLTDQMYVDVLEICQPTRPGKRPRPISDWIREAIRDKLIAVGKMEPDPEPERPPEPTEDPREARRVPHRPYVEGDAED